MTGWLLPMFIVLGSWFIGVPMWVVGIGTIAFAAWFMADRPARYGRPPDRMPRD